MIPASAPTRSRSAKADKKSTIAAPAISEIELRALQELADKYGPCWRTVLMTAHLDNTLPPVLKVLMSRHGAGNEIARVAIIPRSLLPTALYYGGLHFR